MVVFGYDTEGLIAGLTEAQWHRLSLAAGLPVPDRDVRTMIKDRIGTRNALRELRRLQQDLFDGPACMRALRFCT